jgi:hypothetical protein
VTHEGSKPSLVADPSDEREELRQDRREFRVIAEDLLDQCGALRAAGEAVGFVRRHLTAVSLRPLARLPFK